MISIIVAGECNRSQAIPILLLMADSARIQALQHALAIVLESSLHCVTITRLW